MSKKIVLPWGDGVDRTYSILLEDPAVLLCEFPDGDWCTWTKMPDDWWQISAHSNDKNPGVGSRCTPTFKAILNRIHQELAGDMLGNLFVGGQDEQ